jgi:hypothetical protein
VSTLDERLRKRVRAGLGTEKPGYVEGMLAPSELRTQPAAGSTVGSTSPGPTVSVQPLPSSARASETPRWFVPALFVMGYFWGIVVLAPVLLSPWTWPVVNPSGQLLYHVMRWDILAQKLGSSLELIALTCCLVYYLFIKKGPSILVQAAPAPVKASSAFTMPRLRMLAVVATFEVWLFLSYNVVTLMWHQLPAKSPLWFNVTLAGFLPVTVCFLIVTGVVKLLKKFNRVSHVETEPDLPRWTPAFERQRVTASGFPAAYHEYFPEKSSRELQQDHLNRQSSGTMNRLVAGIKGKWRTFGL